MRVNVVELCLVVRCGLAEKPAPTGFGDDPGPPEGAAGPPREVCSLETLCSGHCLLEAALGCGALTRILGVVNAEDACLLDNMGLVTWMGQELATQGRVFANDLHFC